MRTVPTTPPAQIGSCPLCKAPIEDSPLPHFEKHVFNGELQRVDSATKAWFVHPSLGVAVWGMDRETAGPERPPIGTHIEPFPGASIAARAILLGIFPGLVAAVGLLQNIEVPQPQAAIFALGMFVLVLRGFRRMATRSLLRRFFDKSDQSHFIGEATPADRIKPGAWLRLTPDRAGRVIAVFEPAPGTRSLVLTDGATLTVADSDALQSGIVVTGGHYQPQVTARLSQRGEDQE